MTVTLVQIGAGLFLLVVGGRLLIVGAVDFAQTLGVPQAIIGLTLVAVGTSLPELVTSLVATLRGQGDIVIGCVVGSNVFNVLGILGTTALVVPLEPEVISLLDLLLMVGLSLALGL